MRADHLACVFRAYCLTAHPPWCAQFGGYYVNEGNVPRVLRWVPSASLIKHGFEGLCASEFPGLAFEPAPAGGGRGDLTDGDQARYPGP